MNGEISDLLDVIRDLRRLLEGFKTQVPIKVAYGEEEYNTDKAGKTVSIFYRFSKERVHFSEKPIVIPVAIKRAITKPPKIVLPDVPKLPDLPKLPKIDIPSIPIPSFAELPKIDIKLPKIEPLELNFGKYSHFLATYIAFGRLGTEEINNVPLYKDTHSWFVKIVTVMTNIFDSNPSVGSTYTRIIQVGDKKRKIKIKIIPKSKDPEIDTVASGWGRNISAEIYYVYNFNNWDVFMNLIADTFTDIALAGVVKHEGDMKEFITQLQTASGEGCKNLPWWSFVSPLAWAIYFGAVKIGNWCSISDNVRKAILATLIKFGSFINTLGTTVMTGLFSSNLNNFSGVLHSISGTKGAFDNIVKEVNSIFKQVNNTFEDFKKQLKNAMNNLGNTLNNMLDGIQDWNRNAFEWASNVQEVLGTFKSSIEVGINNAIKSVFDNLGIVETSSAEAWIPVPVYIKNIYNDRFEIYIPKLPEFEEEIPVTTNYGFVVVKVYVLGKPAKGKFYVEFRGPETIRDSSATFGKEYKLKPGRYTLYVRYGRFTATKQIIIQKGKKTTVVVNLRKPKPKPPSGGGHHGGSPQPPGGGGPSPPHGPPGGGGPSITSDIEAEIETYTETIYIQKRTISGKYMKVYYLAIGR